MTKRAVIIGINYNETPQYQLHGCIKDAIAMQNLLIDAYGYNKSNIIVLRDDGFPSSLEPTRSNILASLNKVISESKSTDEIWVHYSGHGSYIPDENGEEYDRYDEVIVPSDTNNLIVDDELKQLLSKNPETPLIHITLDCCHSGTGWDLPFLFRHHPHGISRHQVGHTIQNKRVYMFSGARDHQTAADAYNAEQVEPMGAFTEAFIECTRFHGHNVSLFQLHKDINLYLEEKHHTQRCEFTSSNSSPFKTRITRAKIEEHNRSLNTQTIRNNMRQMNFK